MTPEFKKAKPSAGWAKHERRRKAAEKKAAVFIAPTTPTEVPPDPRTQAWIEISGTIQRTFDDQPDLLMLFRRKKGGFFREFFDGRYDKSMGKGSERFDALTDKYLNPNSASYNPDLFDRAGPILMVITAETDRMSQAKRLMDTRR
ncbi:MAG: hypothetical protein HYT06_01370 [Candidatus Levybacteria bacterium]|nr:hypothetical protein [Candidatus Levybacteria bacterium]